MPPPPPPASHRCRRPPPGRRRPRRRPPTSASVSSVRGLPAFIANSQSKVDQACIPCRRRKVRCDLGSVDNPNDPPCVRCRRESKECFFSATRRKRKADDTDDVDSNDEDDYIVRNGRKKPPTAESPPLAHLDRRLYSDVPLTPGGRIGRSQPLRRPLDGPSAPPPLRRGRESDGGGFGVDGEANTPLENFEARNVMRREVYGPHDALELLYKAATDRLGNPHGPTPSPPRRVCSRASYPPTALTSRNLIATPMGPPIRRSPASYTAKTASPARCRSPSATAFMLTATPWGPTRPPTSPSIPN